MSLFDVIRYPISIPPHPGELEALPADLFKEWIDKHTIDWRLVDSEIKYDPIFVSGWMSRSFNCGLDYKDIEIAGDLHSLKKLIKEWQS